MKSRNYYLKYICLVGIIGSSCKKIVVPAPVGSITTNQVFSTDAQATAAAAGMYYNMINIDRSLSSSSMTIFGGLAADELIPFDQTTGDGYIQFANNDLVATNNYLTQFFWADPYSVVYTANSVIAGLQGSGSVHDSVKKELIGEAKFVRAFLNFYLVNVFGDIPLVTTINWHNSSLLPRTSTPAIYQSIIADLLDAQNSLPSDYSEAGGERIVPNKWAATALLARVYLCAGNWSGAEEQATIVINNTSLFGLVNNLDSVFYKNNSEAIWQLQQNDGNSYNATPEGYLLVPFDSTSAPLAYLSPQLLNAFEPNDQRRLSWVDSTTYGGIKYYYPFKYKLGPSQAIPNTAYTEYYVVLRLAEQYLIRAEARLKLNKFSDALSDINVIRQRAGLSPLSSASSPSDLFSALMHERQIELFAEWGNRWLDLKREGLMDPVLGSIKPGWNSNDTIWPIPVNDLKIDPNLTQNPGY